MFGSLGNKLEKQNVQKPEYVLLPVCRHPLLIGSLLALQILEPPQSGHCDLNLLCSHIGLPLDYLQSCLLL